MVFRHLHPSFPHQPPCSPWVLCRRQSPVQTQWPPPRRMRSRYTRWSYRHWRLKACLGHHGSFSATFNGLLRHPYSHGIQSVECAEMEEGTGRCRHERSRGRRKKETKVTRVMGQGNKVREVAAQTSASTWVLPFCETTLALRR